MKPTWHKASGAFLDRDDRMGTVGIFWNYDIGNWSFGIRIENDPSWFDFNIDMGPLNISFIYWRIWASGPAESI